MSRNRDLSFLKEKSSSSSKESRTESTAKPKHSKDQEPIKFTGALPYEELECPVCMEVPPGRALECKTCHKFFCELCINHLVKRCPVCRTKPFRTQVNSALSLLFDRVRKRCEFCEENFPRADLEVHRRYCRKRPRQCSASRCNFSTCNPDEALKHISELHKDLAWDAFEKLFSTTDAAANSNKVRRLKASASSSAPAPAAASAPRSSDSERESSETPEPYEYMSDSSDDQREVRDEDLGEDDEEDAYLDSEDEVEDDEARAIAGEDQELFL